MNGKLDEEDQALEALTGPFEDPVEIVPPAPAVTPRGTRPPPLPPSLLRRMQGHAQRPISGAVARPRPVVKGSIVIKPPRPDPVSTQPPQPRSAQTPDEAHAHRLDEQSLLHALLDTVRFQSVRRMETRGEIGRGGMGAVTEEFDALLQRPTAKKTLLDRVRDQPVVVRAFIREAQITGQLDHPNIVPVHDLGIDDQGRLFFTMKRVVGRTLDEVMDEDEDKIHIDNFTERLAARMEIMVKVCDALAFAHSRGVLHCDIKAQNIMVGDYGQVYLMDWGFAQLLPPRPGRRHVDDILPHLPRKGEQFVLGTPGYMSPEQARGERLDERADVFSLGALMHLLLTGQLLYQGPTPVETIMMGQRAEYRLLDEGTQPLKIPGELVRIVNRAVAKERDERYPNVDELRADLQQFLRGGSSFPVRLVKAGTVLIREGDEGDEAYIIVSGQCEVFTRTGTSTSSPGIAAAAASNSDRLVLQKLGPGDVFGEMALLAGAPRMASVVALSDVRVVVVDRGVIEQEVRSMKPWMGAFMRAFAQRVRDLQQRSDSQRSDSQRSRSSVEERPWWSRKWW